MDKMSKVMEYEPPEILTYKAEDLFKNFGPALSCSGYGGAVTGC